MEMFFIMFCVAGFLIGSMFPRYVAILLIVAISILWGVGFGSWGIATFFELFVGYGIFVYINKKNVTKNISDIVDKFKEEYSGGYTVLKNKNTNSIHINEALDVESLEDAVKKRGVKYIFHFTNEKNVESIIENGLLPRNFLESIGMDVSYNDALRLDRKTDYNCLSISYPNSKMFYKYRMKSKDNNENWAIIVYYASVLYEKNCLFYPTNAANHAVRDLPDRSFQGVAAFNALFENDEIRERLFLPDVYPTDEQAEVLVKNPIESRYIHSIVFDKQNLVEKYRNKYQNIKFIYSTMPYNSRSYYLESKRRK